MLFYQGECAEPHQVQTEESSRPGPVRQGMTSVLPQTRPGFSPCCNKTTTDLSTALRSAQDDSLDPVRSSSLSSCHFAVHDADAGNVSWLPLGHGRRFATVEARGLGKAG